MNQGATDKPCTTNVTFAAGETKSIRVEYYDRASVASIQLKTYNGSAGGDGIVPSSWLAFEITLGVGVLSALGLLAVFWRPETKVAASS
mgnify:CR=1 FL=1